MNLEDIKRINREALNEAKGSSASTEMDYTDNRHLMLYGAGVAVAAVAYYLLMNKYTPELLMTTVNGVKQVDRNRVIAASVLAGVVAVGGYHYMYGASM